MILIFSRFPKPLKVLIPGITVVVLALIIVSSFTSSKRESNLVAVGTELFPDGSFENSKLSDFEIVAWRQGGIVTIDEKNGKSGHRALSINSPDIRNDIDVIKNLSVEESTAYAVSVWVKSMSPVDGKGGAKISLDHTGKGSSYSINTSEWNELRCTFKTAKRQTSVKIGCRLGDFNGDTKGHFLFDDMSVRKIKNAVSDTIIINGTESGDNDWKTATDISAAIIKYLSIAVIALIFILLCFFAFKELKEPGAHSLSIHAPETRKSVFHEIMHIAAVVLFSRVLVIFIAELSVTLINPDRVMFSSGMRDLLVRWDGSNYLHMAEFGYTTTGDHRYYIAFFPFYSLCIKFFHFIIPDYFFAAFAVSNASLVAAAFFLYRIVLQISNREKAMAAVAFLCFFPYTCILGTIYTEGIFLAIALASWYTFRKRKWAVSSILIFCLCLTKVQGILILIPAFIEFIFARNEAVRSGNKFNYFNVLYFFSGFAALGIYLLINNYIFGNPFQFMIFQKEHWGQQFGFFANTLQMSIEQTNRFPAGMAYFHWIPQVIAFFIGISAAGYLAFKRHISLAAWLFAYTFVSFSATWLLSGNRYMTAAFPAFIAAGLLTGDKKIFPWLLAASAGLMALVTGAYIQGRFVV
jgi:hypothetical protein